MATDATGAKAEAQLVVAYRQLSRRLRELLRQAEAAGRSTTFLRGQLAAVQRALRAVLGAEAAFDVAIETQYVRSGAAAQLTLVEAGATIITPSFTGIDRATVRILQEATTGGTGRLGFLRQALTEGLALGDPRGIAPRIEEALGPDGLLVRTVGGELKVLTPSGKYWDPTAYSRMVGRTTIADTRRVAFRQRYVQNGVDVVRVVPNGTIHEVCRVWEGRQLSLTGATPGLPTVEDARAAGLFHPNCRHRYVMDVDAAQPQSLPVPQLLDPGPATLAFPISSAVPTARVPEASVPASSVPEPQL